MMKKTLLSLMLTLCCSAALLAVPAHPAKYQFKQPDGTVIVLQNHGDEFYHWTTNESGQIVEKDADGFWRPSRMTPQQRQVLRRQALNGYRARWSDHDHPRERNFGDRKILCIIANFTDSTFIGDDPNAHFDAMLNQEGYSEGGSYGSVRDYYMENSLGQYRPHFDVFGPVTLSHSSTYYDKNEEHGYRVSEAIREAYDLLIQSGVDIPIADYDSDNDGTIDMVLFYYPGHNEAEGAGSESIWPHQSTGNFGELGGKTFNRYFCTSELRGYRGTDYSFIGTTCHEFAHSLGLPDFYDTDYEDNGYNEFTTGYFDLMAGGNYNDNGRRPPYLTAIERYMLGWMDELPEISDGAYTLAPVQQNAAYLSRTETDGEYFILECRNGDGWDSTFDERGLLVYHIDQSEVYDVNGEGKTGSYLWKETNKINVYGGHPCCYIVPTNGGHHTLPSIENIDRFQFTDWNGEMTGVMLSDIAFNGQQASFSVAYTAQRMLLGYVYDTFGNPLSGAQVVRSRSAHPFNAAPALLADDVLAETGADGYYEVILPDTDSDNHVLTVRKDGYVPVSLNLEGASHYIRQHFYLPRKGEGEHSTLQYYDPDLSITMGSFPGYPDIGVGFRYQADSLAKMGLIGNRIETIHFRATPGVYEKAYVFVAFQTPGNDSNKHEIQLLREVTDCFVPGIVNKIYVGDADLTIPEGKTVYIGYGLTGLSDNQSPIPMYGPLEVRNEGDVFIRNFLGDEKWGRVSFNNGTLFFDFIVGAEISAPAGLDFRMLGFASIMLVEGVPTAVPPADKTLYRVEWTLDGQPVEAPAAVDTLPEGSHSYMAHLYYYDGTSERVYYETD